MELLARASVLFRAGAGACDSLIVDPWCDFVCIIEATERVISCAAVTPYGWLIVISLLSKTHSSHRPGGNQFSAVITGGSNRRIRDLPTLI